MVVFTLSHLFTFTLLAVDSSAVVMYLSVVRIEPASFDRKEYRTMHLYILISVGAFLGMFILFLVVSKTLNNIINHLTKLEFILTRELEYKREAVEIRRIFSNKTVDPREAAYNKLFE
jgi:hypothetical protein